MAKPIISTQILGCLKPGWVWSSGILSTKQTWWSWERVPKDSIGKMLHLSRKIKLFVLFIFPVISFMLLCFWMFWGCKLFVFFCSIFWSQEAHSRITSSRHVAKSIEMFQVQMAEESCFCLKINEGQETDPPLKLTAFSHPNFGWLEY